MGQPKDAPRPDEPYLQTVDPELLAHALVTILLKNTSFAPDLIGETLKAWRERFVFHGESITMIDVMVENGNLERYKVSALMKAAEYSLKRREDRLFGKRAFRKGLITTSQLDDALAFQKQLFKALYEVKRLETILVDDGFLDPEDAAEIWREYELAKETRRGVARPASLARAAKSLGIELNLPGTDGDGQAAAVDDADGDASASGDSELFAPLPSSPKDDRDAGERADRPPLSAMENATKGPSTISDDVQRVLSEELPDIESQ